MSTNQSTNKYRPQVGETIFLAFVESKPFLTMVTGFYQDGHYPEDMFDYVNTMGSADSSCLANATFYPDTPVDTKFVYTAILEPSEGLYDGDIVELEYFFTPDDAFDYLDSVKTGKIKPNHSRPAGFCEYSVRVERV